MGRESLDELEAMVRARFSGVVNTGVSPPTFPGHPYDGACQQMLEVVPIKEVQSIKLSFPIKDRKFVLFVSWPLAPSVSLSVDSLFACPVVA